MARRYYGSRRAGAGGAVVLALVVLALLSRRGSDEQQHQTATSVSRVYAPVPSPEPPAESTPPAPIKALYAVLPAVSAPDAPPTPEGETFDKPQWVRVATPGRRPVNARRIETDRVVLESALSSAKDEEAAARGRAVAAVRGEKWYEQAAGQLRALERSLQEARVKGTAREKLAASAAWNKARVEVQRRESFALAKDKALVAADGAVKSAVAELEEFDRDERRRVAEREAMAAAERERVAGYDDTDDDTAHGGASQSGGPVHVRGYTRKDGTYVAPHTRSRPDGTKSNNKGSSRGGGRGRR